MRDAIGSKPVTAVVAAAGYGKTTAVRAWLEGRPVRWCSGSTTATLSRADAGSEPFVVVDRPALLTDEPPSGVRLVLVSRTPLSGPVSLWRGRGIVADIGPSDLSIDVMHVTRLLYDHGVADPSVSTALHELTGGWPALVRMGAEALAHNVLEPAELAAMLAASGTRTHRFINDEVCADLPPAARRLATDLAQLDWVTEDLVVALNQRDGRRTLRHLIAVGLTQPVPGGAPRYRMVPLVAAVLRGRRRLSARRRVLTAAADWYAARQEPAAAIGAALAADNPHACAALLTRHGQDLLGQGQPAMICRAVRTLPPEAVNDRIRLLHAEAAFMSGDIEESLSIYEMMDRGGALPAELAWRFGMARYLHGDTQAGLELLCRGEPGADSDGALLLAWRAAAYWKLGDANACGETAARAHGIARCVKDGKALAAAHIALALHAQLTGDRPTIQAHYEQALAVAESIGDRFSVVRMRTNRTASLLHEARYSDALHMIESAVALAEAAGYDALLVLALCNQGEVYCRLGRFDGAAAAYERATTLCQRMRSRKVVYALAGLGDVYRQRGWTSQARAAYEEAIRLLADGGDWQVRVRALAGLARAIAETDPEQARGLAERAVAEAPGPFLATALVSAGWAAAMAAQRGGPASDGWADARRLADAAAEAARRQRDRAALAEALELSAYAAADPNTARQMLTEALGIWTAGGAELDADRVRLALHGTVEARLAAERLALAGVVTAGPGWARTFASDPILADQTALPAPVRLYALGRFSVVVDGEPVPLSAWRSRKARDLLRVLVSRRGRAIARDELSELLWPDEPAERVAHRLSVALSMVRCVLDPRRRAGADYFIGGDAMSLALNTDRLSIDAETFAEYARYGLDQLRAGRWRDARAALEAAERAYVGDFLDDEPYDDYAATMREQMRANFLRVTRALAGVARQAQEPDEAVRCLLRLLDADPYDEQAHRDLIEVLSECGRHGEARRAHTRYSRAMNEILADLPGRV